MVPVVSSLRRRRELPAMVRTVCLLTAGATTVNDSSMVRDLELI